MDGLNIIGFAKIQGYEEVEEVNGVRTFKELQEKFDHEICYSDLMGYRDLEMLEYSNMEFESFLKDTNVDADSYSKYIFDNHYIIIQN